MTVYVDDAGIPATVGRHTNRWSHLTADTREELHEFADRLGLRREWFQDPCAPDRKPWPARPGSPAAESWHYDVTASKRAQAIRLGARPITWREAREHIRARAGLPSRGGSSTAEITQE